MAQKTKLTRKKIYLQIRSILLVLLGCFVLALGDAAFIVPTNLLTGGIASIAIIVQYVVNGVSGGSFPVADIVTAGLEIILFFVGLFVLGKKFSAHTLLASLAYPAFFALLYRTNAMAPIYNALTTNFSEPFVGYLLCGIFGGVLVGTGVAITLIGGGSTGGLDIIAVILNKFAHIRESATTFTLDATIVVIGVIVMKDYPDILPLGLIGVISAVVCALMIQIFYGSLDSNCVAEVITCEEKKVVDFIEDELLRGCTIIYAEGGYSHEPKRMVKVALNKTQAEELKAFIYKVDPKAFMMVSPSASINGEGFLPFMSPRAAALRRFWERNDAQDDKQGEDR